MGRLAEWQMFFQTCRRSHANANPDTFFPSQRNVRMLPGRKTRVASNFNPHASIAVGFDRRAVPPMSWKGRKNI